MKAFASLVIAACILDASALAQTRCPVGVRMGDPRCMPDAPAQIEESPPPQAPRAPVTLVFPRFGAIAIDSTTGKVGVSEGKSFDFEAERSALKACVKRRRSHSCKMIAVYVNECAAIAWPKVFPAHPMVRLGETEEIAKRAAMDVCEKQGVPCDIDYSACALPVTRNY